MFVVEKCNSPLITGVAQALSVLNIPVVSWELRTKSTIEMAETLNPSVVIISRESYRVFRDEVMAGFSGPIVVPSTKLIDIQDRCVKMHVPYCINPIILDGVKEMESYKAAYSIINDCNIPLYVLNNVISILKDHGILKYKVYGPRVIDSPHFVGSLQQTSYGFVYKNSNIIDYSGEHYGNAEMFGNRSVMYSELEECLMNRLSNSVNTDYNCFNLVKEMFSALGMGEVPNIDEVMKKYV